MSALTVTTNHQVDRNFIILKRKSIFLILRAQYLLTNLFTFNSQKAGFMQLEIAFAKELDERRSIVIYVRSVQI